MTTAPAWTTERREIRPPAPHARRAPAVPAWALWGTGLALLVPLLVGRQLPTEDGFAHLAWTEVFRSLGSARSAWEPFYARSVHWNTPNLTYFGMQLALGSVLEPHLAQRVIIAALIVTWVAAVQVLSRQLSGRITPGALASLLLVHSSWLYGGYLGFLVGVPGLLVAVALLAGIIGRAPDPGARAYVGLALLGMVAYYCHLVVGVTLLIFIAIAALVGRSAHPERSRRLLLCALPPAVLVLSYVGRSPEHRLGEGGIRWEPAWKTTGRFVGFAFFRGFASPGPLFWIALALFAGIVIVLVVDAARTRWDEGPALRRFALLAILALTLVYVLAPDGVGGGYNLKGRFQFLLWAWLLPSLPCALPRRTHLAVLTGLGLLVVWQVTEFGARARRFDRAYAPIVARAMMIPRGSTIERTLDYEHAAFDGSFMRVLAHAPEDIAYRCGCVLLGGYHPSTAFYWVGTRPVTRPRPRFHLEIRQLAGAPISLAIVASRDSSAR